MDVTVTKVAGGVVTCSLHYSEMPSSQLPHELTFKFPRKFPELSIAEQLEAVKECLKLPQMKFTVEYYSVSSWQERHTSRQPSQTESCDFVVTQPQDDHYRDDDCDQVDDNGIAPRTMQAFTPNDDIAHQKRSMVAIPVVSATASEGFSSKKSIPSPKVNSWNEPIRPSNSSNTDPTLSPKIMNKYLRVSRLSKASYPDQLSENMKMSSNHLVRVSVHAQSKMPLVMSSLVEKDNKIIRTIHDFLHVGEKTTCLTQWTENEDHHDHKDYGDEVKDYMNTLENCPCTTSTLSLCQLCTKYWHYMEHHLEESKCPDNHCSLWKLLLIKKRQYSLYKYAPAGMVLFSRVEERVGVITADYGNYNANEIGFGGFGRVYEHTVQVSGQKVAVKEEIRASSLVSNRERFMEIQNLNHPNVLFLQEYVVAHDDSKLHHDLPLLFVMTHYHHRGLNEPFTQEGMPKCLLDYMSRSEKKAPYVFRNLLVISLDLFKALEYFAFKGLVHRDVKRSNILLKLGCTCSSGIECCCPGKGMVTAILSDFDLVEKATVDGKWARLSNNEPSGTLGMKAPELFFVDENGEDMFTGKADIWSAFLTIMHVLLGKNENEMALDKVTEFFGGINSGIYGSEAQLRSSIKTLNDLYQQQTHDVLFHTIKVLEVVQSNIKQLCRFQGGRRQAAKPKLSTKAHARDNAKDNYCPVAEVLTAVHGASVMPQVCIKKVQHVFQSDNPLQETMKETWEIIQGGMCFCPESRPHAKEVVEKISKCLDKFVKSGSVK